MDVTRSERVVLHSEQSFDLTYDTMTFETGEEMILVHLDVHIFSKTVLKRLFEVVDRIRPTLPPIIFCQPANPSTLFDKFVSRFGWKLQGDCWCEDGLNRRIYVHYRDFDGFKH